MKLVYLKLSFTLLAITSLVRAEETLTTSKERNLAENNSDLPKIEALEAKLERIQSQEMSLKQKQQTGALQLSENVLGNCTPHFAYIEISYNYYMRI